MEPVFLGTLSAFFMPYLFLALSLLRMLRAQRGSRPVDDRASEANEAVKGMH